MSMRTRFKFTYASLYVAQQAKSVHVYIRTKIVIRIMVMKGRRTEKGKCQSMALNGKKTLNAHKLVLAKALIVTSERNC